MNGKVQAFEDALREELARLSTTRNAVEARIQAIGVLLNGTGDVVEKSWPARSKEKVTKFRRGHAIRELVAALSDKPMTRIELVRQWSEHPPESIRAQLARVKTHQRRARLMNSRVYGVVKRALGLGMVRMDRDGRVYAAARTEVTAG